MDWADVFTGSFELDSRTWWTALGSAFAVGLILGALPVGAAELFALAAGALPSRGLRVAVIAALAGGQIVGKILWYWLGTLESHVTKPSLRIWIERARGVATRHPHIGLGVTASSATVSIPPFHLVAVAAGLVRTPAVPFFVVAFAGRLVRFGLIALFPPLVRYLFTVD